MTRLKIALGIFALTLMTAAPVLITPASAGQSCTTQYQYNYATRSGQYVTNCN